MENFSIAVSEACPGMAGVFPGAAPISLGSGKSIAGYFAQAQGSHTILILKPVSGLKASAIRLPDSAAGLAYSSLSEYTAGSVRDDFDFGSAVVISNQVAREAIKSISMDTRLAGFYDLRLQISRLAGIRRIPAFCEMSETESEDSEQAQFAYCNPRNRAYQAEAEQVFTRFLRQTGGYVQPVLEGVSDFCSIAARYPATASVIIPVKDRPEVIADAIKSAAGQETSFPFNIIVVDNQSKKPTRDILESCARQYSCLKVIETSGPGIGIGGCWNIAVQSPYCGAIAIQLDSDDVYSGPHTLQTIVDKFMDEHCGVLIGSYRLTDINLEPLNDMIIDHREYTQENGVNNALRVNGFGAPRCYLAELVRRNPFKNVSYGEDYDLCLRLSRQYKVSRIFDVLYLCRRWGKNSDSGLSPEKLAEYNLQKDTFRSQELEQRRMLSKARGQ